MSDELSQCRDERESQILHVTCLHEGDSQNYPELGDAVQVHYVGMFPDSHIFDSSYGNRPYTFVVGSGSVIDAWDAAIVHLSLGETARISVPPELGYGSDGIPGLIPPNQKLIFDITLVTITNSTTCLRCDEVKDGAREKRPPAWAQTQTFNTDGQLVGYKDEDGVFVSLENIQKYDASKYAKRTRSCDVEDIDRERRKRQKKKTPKVERHPAVKSLPTTTGRIISREIVHEGNQQFPQNLSLCTTHFTCLRFPSMEMVSSTKTGEPKTFRLGESGVSSGFDMCVEQMSKGERCRFLVPRTYTGQLFSDYGESDMIYDIELLYFLTQEEQERTISMMEAKDDESTRVSSLPSNKNEIDEFPREVRRNHSQNLSMLWEPRFQKARVIQFTEHVSRDSSNTSQKISKPRHPQKISYAQPTKNFSSVCLGQPRVRYADYRTSQIITNSFDQRVSLQTLSPPGSIRDSYTRLSAVNSSQICLRRPEAVRFCAKQVEPQFANRVLPHVARILHTVPQNKVIMNFSAAPFAYSLPARQI